MRKSTLFWIFLDDTTVHAKNIGYTEDGLYQQVCGFAYQVDAENEPGHLIVQLGPAPPGDYFVLDTDYETFACVYSCRKRGDEISLTQSVLTRSNTPDVETVSLKNCHEIGLAFHCFFFFSDRESPWCFQSQWSWCRNYVSNSSRKLRLWQSWCSSMWFRIKIHRTILRSCPSKVHKNPLLFRFWKWNRRLLLPLADLNAHISGISAGALYIWLGNSLTFQSSFLNMAFAYRVFTFSTLDLCIQSR